MSSPRLPHDLLIGRQAIFGRDGSVQGYELLFRETRKNEAHISDDMQATARVIVDTLMEVGLEQVLGGKRGFVNIGLDFLMEDAIFLLPPQDLVLEILETVPVNDTTVSRCRELRSRGYTLALDDYVGHSKTWGPLLDLVSLVKVDIQGVSEADLLPVVQGLAGRKLSLLAEKVETPQQLEQTMRMGFEYFQGFFFARPVILASRKVDPLRQAVTGILAMVLNDAGTEEIVSAVRPHIDLSASLIRIANVVGKSPSRVITDLRQAVLAMGRAQIRRWLELILFTSAMSDNRYARPVLQMAVTRARLMELLAESWTGSGKPDPEEAFLTGMFSLSGSLLGVTVAEMLEGLPLREEVRRALLEGTGSLGLLLSFAGSVERSALSLDRLLTEVPVPAARIAAAQTESLLWADDIVRMFS